MYMYNRFVLFTCCIYIFLFFSCSNSQEVRVDTDNAEQNTLKYFLNSETNRLTWTDEINPNIVSDKRKDDIERFGAPKYSTTIGASLLPVSDEELVYPYIKNLGSLNMNELEPAQLKFVQDFCEFLISSKDETKNSFFMSPGREYMLTIFFYDMSEIVFDSYIIAAPVIEEETAQFPVRLKIKNGGYIDLLIYVVPLNSNWCIEQIRYGEIVYE